MKRKILKSERRRKAAVHYNLMKDKETTIGHLLLESLTKDQIACMLEVVASAWDLKSLMDEFMRADPDMAATVGEVLKEVRAKTDWKTKSRPVSQKRTMEYWNSLWRQWHEILADIGDEEGKYAVQDHHWEEPYFDGFQLACDIEPIAQEMLGLIDDVYSSVKNPDLFVGALEEIEASIASYPEWMGAEYGEPVELEKNATSCVLKWQWLGLQYQPRPGIKLLAKVCELEKSYKLVCFDQTALVDFFVNLPSDSCREIYTDLQDEVQEIDLGNVYSPWHQINHVYESRFDSTQYLETCRSHLDHSWRYGRPLIDDALNRNEFQEAEQWLEKTFSSFLARKRKKQWYPELFLLTNQLEYFMEEGREEIAALLLLWGKVSLKLGNSLRSVAAQLQGVIFRQPADCETIIKEYKRVINPKTRKTLNHLFEQWKSEMAKCSFDKYMSNPTTASDSWVHWLIEASLNPKKKKEWFLDKLNGWLNDLKKDKKVFKKQWHQLARLTSDLPNSKRIVKKYPVFYKTVLPLEESADDILGSFRRRGLKKMSAGPCLLRVMDVWKEHLHLIVPDPANAYKSDYTGHAGWCNALHELNKKSYTALLSQWRKKHNRRRNLWRDMKAIGLSV